MSGGTVLARLIDPAIAGRGVAPAPSVTRVAAATVEQAAAAFAAARSLSGPLVAVAYHHLMEQVDRQFHRLTDPSGPYRFRVVTTTHDVPYLSAEELIVSTLTCRTLEVSVAEKDRRHPLLDRDRSGAYERFRAVHDLVGHVATGFDFDRDGEYSAWLFQNRFFSGLARWAAATELHGEISVLWVTNRAAEHKAALLPPEALGLAVEPTAWKRPSVLGHDNLD